MKATRSNLATVRSGREMEAALKKIYKEFESEYSDTVREAMLKTRSYLILYTPKATGWASEHWSLGVNYTTEEIELKIDSLNNLKIGDSIFHYNNVPYIARLDEGWSSQRPAGFTHIAINQVTIFLDNKFRKLSQRRTG